MTDNQINVLDHGFVRLVDTMGDDAAIVQAARTSYGEGTKTPSDDRSLIRYLMRHWHTTPFEMCEMKFHMQMPVFVARQWIRHRTANVNEYSARFSIVPDLWYAPSVERLGRQSETNKQGTGEAFPLNVAERYVADISEVSEGAFSVYKNIVEDGMSRELARIILPQNAYTQWYWKCDLHNILHLLRLRCDPHAQWEIREYAAAVAGMVAERFPLAHEAWVDYRLEAQTFSRMEMDALRELIREGGCLPTPCNGMSKREAKEFLDKFKPAA